MTREGGGHQDDSEGDDDDVDSAASPAKSEWREGDSSEGRAEILAQGGRAEAGTHLDGRLQVALLYYIVILYCTVLYSTVQ